MVEFKHVSFCYGAEGKLGEKRLDDVSLTVGKGEFVLLTGPSGCGKTTLLRLINGLAPQFYPGEVSGEVLVDGRKPQRRELYDTALRVGTVFQNPRTQFYNVDTTGELAFACENRGMPEAEIYRRVDDTVARFHLENLMDRSIFHLSDGEKQKIACGSVDVAGTDIILLDEPSANLDHAAMVMLRELIVAWRQQGKTIIAAEHRIAYLWDLIDRAVILRDGRIVCELRGTEKDGITPETLAQMGLRGREMESPMDVPLPELTEGDEAMTLRNFSFAYRGEQRKTVYLPELRLAAGQITAIVGANGAGKTTFLNCLCGLERRCKGVLEYEGKTYDRRARQRLCFMVMQDSGHQLFTESVIDEVLISLPKDVFNARERAEGILRQLDLIDFADRHPQSLSGGQKQRLAIACALASGRRVLLLDEPTSGLDYAHMLETAALLKTLKTQGVTLLVVTHDSELIRACCDRKICL